MAMIQKVPEIKHNDGVNVRWKERKEERKKKERKMYAASAM